MSSFICPKCEAFQLDTSKGYITGCEHHKPDISPEKLNADQKAMIDYARSRGYYIAIPEKQDES